MRKNEDLHCHRKYLKTKAFEQNGFIFSWIKHYLDHGGEGKLLRIILSLSVLNISRYNVYQLYIRKQMNWNQPSGNSDIWHHNQNPKSKILYLFASFLFQPLIN